MINYRDRIITHYESVWGNKSIQKNWEKGPVENLYKDFCVLEFPPTHDRNMWTYATCCLSKIEDNSPIELHIFASEKTDELVELLTVIAHYHQLDKKLDLGHTVNFGKPWMDSSHCTYGLVSLPYLDGPDIENLEYKSNKLFSPKKLIKFYWLIPITGEELEYKKKFGLEELEEKFDTTSFNYLDPKRASVV